MAKRTVTPTLADRLSRASADLNAAVSTFERVAADLDAAASAHDEVAREAQTEIERLVTLRDAATNEAFRADKVASKVRALVA